MADRPGPRTIMSDALAVPGNRAAHDLEFVRQQALLINRTTLVAGSTDGAEMPSAAANDFTPEAAARQPYRLPM